MSRMDRERVVAVELRAAGLSNPEIAERLGVSRMTVAALLRRRARFPSRECLLCGTVFTPTNGRQQFCCVEHRQKHHAQQAGGPTVRECGLCGERFVPNSAPQRYCCVEHRQQHHRPAPTARRCRHCDAWFLPTSGGQQYCTPEHQRLHSPTTVAAARERLAALEAELARVRDRLGAAA